MDATTPKSEYDVKVEDVGAAKKRLVITVPAAVIDEKLETAMGTLASQTSLPGFRKGRAPKSLLERRFGTSVRMETKGQLVAEGYARAIEAHQIRPVGDPEPVGSLEELELTPGQALTFTMDVEVAPEFDLPDLEGLEILKPVLAITDEHVDEELRRQCVQLGEVKSVKSDFAAGDRVVGPGSVLKEGDDEPFFAHDHVDFIIPGSDEGGRGTVLGLLIEDLARQVKGKKVGDVVTIQTVGPESHELEHIRGKKLTITITIREGQHLVPAAVEHVLEHYGMSSEDILREQVQLALEQRRDEEQRGAMREQVYEHLAGAVDFALPEKMSQAQTARMLERQRLEMLYRGGLSADEVEHRLAEMRAQTEAQSRQRLKLMFVLHRLAEHFKVSVSDQEINGRIASIAAQRGERPEKLRQDLMQSGAVGQIAAQIREHKAADRVIDQATVREVEAAEWSRIRKERIEARRGEADAAKPAGGTKKKTTKKKKKTAPAEKG